jgi:histidinol-phosphate aminotransferase
MTPIIADPLSAEDEMAREPRPLSYLFEIAPYVGGESKIAGANRVIRLASNESALGPSPKAVAAYRDAAADIFRYPDGASTDLRAAIARHFDLDAARIVCGTGSDELIGLLARCYAGPGDEVLYSRHGFLMYPIAAQAAGATPVAAQETDLTCDVDSMLALVGPKTRLVYLANPNNPTGTYLPGEEVRRLHRGLPASTILVLDAAYSEFVSARDYESGLELAKSEANVVMLRTFSKIHALAGLRVGWCYGSAEVADVLNRVRGTFNVALPAQAAAIASLADKVSLDRARTHNEHWRPWLAERLRALGLEVTPGVANFVLVRFGYPPKDPHAAFEFLRARFILTRQVGAYHLPEHLRITVGTEEENRAVAAALADFMRAP